MIRPSLLVLTTSYPLHRNSVSGIFVGHLASSLAKRMPVQVLVPDDDRPASESTTPNTQNLTGSPSVHPFRYAPKNHQVLAHGEGGIPVALKQSKLAWFWVLPFLVSMAAYVTKRARYSDVVQANWAICGAIAGLTKWLHRRPVVTTFRGEDLNSRKGLNRLIAKTACAFSDHVVLVSPSQQDALKQLCDTAKKPYRVIFNGVGPEFQLEADAISEKFAEANHLRIVSVGSLIERKNPVLLLNALAAYPSDYPQLIVRIIGDGPDSSRLRELANSLPGNISLSFLGTLSPDAVAENLRWANLFVSASLGEGRPNAVIEAMAMGCAVMLSRIEAHEALVTHGQSGILFDPESAEELGQCITCYAKNLKGLASLAEKGRESRALESLSWESTADHYLALFSSLMSEQAG